MRRLLLAVVPFLAACGGRVAEPPAAAPLPPGHAWQRHLTTELAPFWTTPLAIGTPPGNFPTFRCDDGRLPDPQLPCGELAIAGEWISANLDKDFTRMKSRQTYFYGVAYHLTGDPRMLELARAGADWIRAHALDRETGSAVSWWRAGVPGPPLLARTSQDLAYANLGLAFYAYLTRDPDVLADVLRLRDHVFSAYDEPRWGMLRWAREGPAAEVARQELVAQLDQVNAYLLLVAPIVPEPRRTQLLGDLSRVSRVLIARFWSEEQGLFWGSLHDPLEKVLGSRHTDFGHTIKALWMIERTGVLTGDAALVDFARRNAPRVLARAFLPRAGCWASGVRRDGSLDVGLTWWISAELDQMAATLSLYDPRFTGYLEKTYACWSERFVDREHGEVWSFVSLDDPLRKGPKQHLWKNGYHSAEHALVAYVTTQGIRHRPATLHYAFSETPERKELRPYLFAGEVTAVKEGPLAGFPGRRDVAVTFRGIR